MVVRSTFKLFSPTSDINTWVGGGGGGKIGNKSFHGTKHYHVISNKKI